MNENNVLPPKESHSKSIMRTVHHHSGAQSWRKLQPIELRWNRKILHCFYAVAENKKRWKTIQQHKNDEQRIALERTLCAARIQLMQIKNDKTNSSFSLRSLEAWYVRMSNWVAEFTQFPRIVRRCVDMRSFIMRWNRWIAIVPPFRRNHYWYYLLKWEKLREKKCDQPNELTRWQTINKICESRINNNNQFALE